MTVYPRMQAAERTAHIQIISRRKCMNGQLAHGDTGLFVQSQYEDIGTLAVGHGTILGCAQVRVNEQETWNNERRSSAETTGVTPAAFASRDDIKSPGPEA